MPPLLAYIVAMVRHVKLAAALSLLVALTGCTSVARRLDVSIVKEIRTGMERREVEQIFKAPNEVVTGPNRNDIARYFYHRYRVLNEASAYQQINQPGEMLIRMLTLEYDQKGIVQRKIHDESVSPVRRSHTGWYELGPLLDVQALSIQPKNDTAANLIKQFGEPMSRSLDKDGRDLLIWFYFKERPDYLGQSLAKRLMVSVDAGGSVIDYTLVDDNPRVWFRR